MYFHSFTRNTTGGGFLWSILPATLGSFLPNVWWVPGTIIHGLVWWGHLKTRLHGVTDQRHYYVFGQCSCHCAATHFSPGLMQADHDLDELMSNDGTHKMDTTNQI